MFGSGLPRPISSHAKSISIYLSLSIYLSAEHYRDLDFRSGSRAFFRLFSVGVEELAEDRKCAYGAKNTGLGMSGQS